MANLKILDDLVLASGGHNSFDQGACLLEATSYVAGEPWSDHPTCVSPVLGAYGRRLNDRLSDEDRQKLKPFILRLLNTADDGQDGVRRWLAADWAIRVATPRWLDAAGLTEDAAALRALSPIIDSSTNEASREVIWAAREHAYEARLRSRTALRERVQAELVKRGSAVADAVADAAAAAVADAAAAADADADAVADAVADAAAAAAAAADADADADAVAVADAVADAAAAAVADAAAAAAADAVADAAANADAAADEPIVKYSPRWYEIYDAAYAEYRKRWQAMAEGTVESVLGDVIRTNNAEAIDLLDRMIDPKSNAAAA